MSKTSTSSIITLTGITVVGAIVAYAAYFDYKRRNDASFRRKLQKQKKKVDRAVSDTKEKEEKESQAPIEIPHDLLVAIYEKSKEEPIPVTPEEKHQYFVGVVAMAERLVAQGPENYLEGAIYFYQALRVYPSPAELIEIYKKTVPGPVLKLIMELYNMDVLGRINGYYDQFPPKSMNVSVKQFGSKEERNGQTLTHVLVANKSFKAGEAIYKEKPVVASLDCDLQGRGTHCSHCLREVIKDEAVIPDSDRLGSVYCSEVCQIHSNSQSQRLLFGEKNFLPPELAGQVPEPPQEARIAAMDAFINYWRKVEDAGLLLVARLISIQVIAELAKFLPEASKLKSHLPEFCLGTDYTVYDHLERLRHVDTEIPEDDHKSFNNLLVATLPFLSDGHSDERHNTFRNQMAYNAIGICLGEGRDDKVPLTEKSERTRTPSGTSKQVGTGLYLVSSYLAHSCSPSTRPAFHSGDSELYLVAERDIEAGEELSMSYVDASEAFSRRQAEISRGWKFTCVCSKCEEDKKSSRESTLQLASGDVEIAKEVENTQEVEKVEAVKETNEVQEIKGSEEIEETKQAEGIEDLEETKEVEEAKGAEETEEDKEAEAVEEAEEVGEAEVEPSPEPVPKYESAPEPLPESEPEPALAPAPELELEREPESEPTNTA